MPMHYQQKAEEQWCMSEVVISGAIQRDRLRRLSITPTIELYKLLKQCAPLPEKAVSAKRSGPLLFISTPRGGNMSGWASGRKHFH